MNTINYQYNDNTQLVFSDNETTAKDGVLLEGSFYNETSLLEDELSIDTMKIKVRCETYPLQNFIYGQSVTFYQDTSLYGKYYLVSVERQTKYEYILNVQSSIGLLDDTMHYGGIYSGQYASDIIKDIIGGKISYTEHAIFSKIKVYGWLPVSTRRDNLKQLLFAVGGCVKKKDGDVYFTTLTVDTPKVIPSNKVYDTGKITYDSPASRIEVIEHQFSKVDSVSPEEVYSGEIIGSSFVTPKGYSVNDAALITWDNPYHSLTFDGCTLLNNEYGVNYVVVSSSASATIMGKPYIHSKMIVSRDKENYKGKEKVAKVENATLVSLANSNSVAEKVMAYYDSPCTLSGAIILEGEKPLDNLTMPNQFEEETTGMIKSIQGTLGKQITKGEVDLRMGYNPPPIQGSRTLVSIAVTTPPTKTVYEAGDSFDKSGMVVTATYDDASTSIVTNYSISPITLSKNDTYVTISYREIGVTATTTISITVKNLLKQIVIAIPPEETAYEIGDTVNLSGMVLMAYYSDGSSKQVTDYDYSPKTISSNDDTEITISYTEDGITKTTVQDVTVGNTPDLLKIEITEAPNKLRYNAGEYFDRTGMVVKAYFSDGTNRVITGYTYSPSGALGKDDTTITISYTKKGITKTALVAITVIYLDRIAVTNEPTYKTYYDDQTFNTEGMEITAYYSNNTSKVVTTYTYTPTGDLPYGTTEIIISFTDGGITQTTTQAITVNIRTYDYTKSKVISSGGTYTLSGIGATHRNIRVVCIGGGNGGTGGRNGSSGSAGGNASVSLGSKGYSIASNGSGGSGGNGGVGGSGGKVFQKDFLIPKLSDSFTITIGSGGSGGAVATSGSSGNATTFTYNGTTASSATGSSSSTGYTNTFTGSTYAISGTEGIAGGDGGEGFQVTSASGTAMIRYNYVNAKNGGSVVYNGTTYEGGTIYTQQSADVNYNNVTIGVGAGGGGSGGAAAGNNSSAGNSSRMYGQNQSPRFVAYAAAGGTGASAVAPSAPTTYGNGGNGGNGGGGGGGASGGIAMYGNVTYGADTNPYKNDTPKVVSGSGGSGGSGSKGSNGAQGCVIIYYS